MTGSGAMRGRARSVASAAGRIMRKATVVTLSLLWLVAVVAPLYYLVAVSFEPEATSLFTNPWFPNHGVTFRITQPSSTVAIFGTC